MSLPLRFDKAKYGEELTEKLIELYNEIAKQDEENIEEIIESIEEEYGDEIIQEIASEWLSYTPIHYAIQHAYDFRVASNISSSHINLINIVSLLEDKGVDIDAQDKDGNTAVHMAVMNNDLDSVIMLDELAAELNIPNKLGYTPYHLAVRNNNKLIINYLKPRIDTTEFAEGSKALTFSERKWLGVKYSPKKSVYLFLGHGSENVCFQEREILPEGYTLVTFSKCGKVAYGDDVIELINIFGEIGKIPGTQTKLAEGDADLLKHIKTMRKANNEFRVYKTGDRFPNLLFHPISNQSSNELSPEYFNKSGVYKINVGRFNPNKFIKQDNDGEYEEVRWNFENDTENHIVFKHAFKGSSYPTEKSMVLTAKKNMNFISRTQELYTESVYEIMKRLGPGTYFFPSCRSTVCSFSLKTNNNISVKNNIKKNIKLTRRLSNRQQKIHFPDNYNTDNNIMNEVKPMNYYKKPRKTRKYK